MSKFKFLICSVFILIPIVLKAQYKDFAAHHSDEYGAGITVAMSGFGLGGYYRFALPNFFFVGANLDLYMMRDEKQLDYYDPYWQVYVERNKQNRLFVIPLAVELKKRLFQDNIEENFRPYIIGMGGLTFGMNFPKDYYRNGQKISRDNEYQTTFNFAIGAGIDFTTRDAYYLSIRPQYRINYFPTQIAGKKNHSNFEIRLEIGKRVFEEIDH